MKKNEIINEIQKNGGITLDKGLDTLKATKGYMVSLEGHEKTTTNTEQVYNLIKEYQKMIKGNNNLYIGAWNDKGLYYVDISIYITRKVDAVSFGKKNNQLAIYDLKNKCSIYLNYNITFYTLYNKKMEIIKQYDKLDNIIKDIKTSKKNIKNRCNSGKLINELYYIYSDNMNINELAN